MHDIEQFIAAVRRAVNWVDPRSPIKMVALNLGRFEALNRDSTDTAFDHGTSTPSLPP